jgi:hypothetical protein
LFPIKVQNRFHLFLVIMIIFELIKKSIWWILWNVWSQDSKVSANYLLYLHTKFVLMKFEYLKVPAHISGLILLHINNWFIDPFLPFGLQSLIFWIHFSFHFYISFHFFLNSNFRWRSLLSFSLFICGFFRRFLFVLFSFLLWYWRVYIP